MGKTWVLDTETKGTGAQMVPLDKVLRTPAPEPKLNLVRLPRPARRREAPEVREKPSRRFRVTDVMTRQTLADAASTQATIEVLERVRSVVDVTIYVWEPQPGRWRPLTLAEQQALWAFRGRRAERS